MMPDMMAGAAACGVFGVLALVAFALGFGLLGALTYGVFTGRTRSRGPGGPGQNGRSSAVASASSGA